MRYMYIVIRLPLACASNQLEKWTGEGQIRTGNVSVFFYFLFLLGLLSVPCHTLCTTAIRVKNLKGNLIAFVVPYPTN